MMRERPEAIMINVPESFFSDKSRGPAVEHHFRMYYESMEGGLETALCFYHFISCVPVHAKNILHVYVCFRGFVRYRAIVVEFLKNQPVHVGTYHHDEPRDWVVTTGPVVKAPQGMVQKGFRGFRYCDKLF